MIDWLIKWLIERLINWLIDWTIDWLIKWLIDRLIKCMIDWFTEFFIDRSIFWLNIELFWFGVGHKDFDLTYLEEAYTTEHWLVRIYRSVTCFPPSGIRASFYWGSGHFRIGVLAVKKKWWGKIVKTSALSDIHFFQFFVH